MSNSEVPRIQLNQDGTISLEVRVHGFDEGTPIEISGQATQQNGAVAPFYSVQEMPTKAEEGAVLTLDSIPTVPPNSFAAGFPITVVARVAEAWITTLEAVESPVGDSLQALSVGSGAFEAAWKSNYYGPALFRYRPPDTRTRSGKETIDTTQGLGLPVGEPNWATELGAAGGTALIIGARSGVGRVALSGFTVSPDEFWGNFETAARPLLDLALAEEGGFNPHGLGLLSEVIATAVAVRIAHGETRLTQTEVQEFLPQLVTLENTFWTGCDPT